MMGVLMGLELKTTVKTGGNTYEGMLHLDSKELTFRSKDFRYVGEIAKLKAKTNGDELVVTSERPQLRFAIGAKVSRWLDKIENPPSRLTKLGVKDGFRCWVSTGFTKAFAQELRDGGSSVCRDISACDLAFWKVTNREQLEEFALIAEQLPSSINLWIVWPKGVSEVGQTDVMNAAKSYGYGPSKTAAFDDAHSSMRFKAAKKSK